MNCSEWFDALNLLEQAKKILSINYDIFFLLNFTFLTK